MTEPNLDEIIAQRLGLYIQADLLRRRHSGFRYCASCLFLTPPEFRFDLDSSQTCAAQRRRVVY